MKDKKNIIYSVTIIVLIIALGVIWFFLVNPLQDTSTAENANNNSSSISYSATKKITTDETITNGAFTSTNSDENAILASGSITANLSDITVAKTGDSDGGDNTSFYVTNTTAEINLEN